MFAILIVQLDGDEHYLCDGTGDTPTKFSTRAKAEEYVGFMKIGMEGDVQSINVVYYPARASNW